MHGHPRTPGYPWLAYASSHFDPAVQKKRKHGAHHGEIIPVIFFIAAVSPGKSGWNRQFLTRRNLLPIRLQITIYYYIPLRKFLRNLILKSDYKCDTK